MPDMWDTSRTAMGINDIVDNTSESLKLLESEYRFETRGSNLTFSTLDALENGIYAVGNTTGAMDALKFNATANGTGSSTAPMSFHFGNGELVRLISISTILCFLATMANLISVISICHIPGRLTANQLLFLNLSITDILAAFFTYTEALSMVTFYWVDISLNFSFYLRYMGYILFVWFYCTSALTLLIFAICRYVAIYRPIGYTDVFTVKKIGVALIMIWIISAMLSLPGMCFFFDYNTKHVACELWNYFWPCAILLSPIVTLFLYIRVSRYLRTRSARWRSEHGADENYHAFLTTIMLMVTLTLSLLPYIIFRLARYRKNMSTIYYDFVYFLPFINFATDPVIYGLRTKNIRVGYSKLSERICKCTCAGLRRHTNYNEARRSSPTENTTTI
ncbi:unnamed protein product [Owenia fusiformis]|uniref:Uncharacterized protein n=1 Tax=Owenia fusiformis TaxID=6347 RepID=A0A8J1UYW6_OWEFU|nr:unnamed protein product [Owenia fusiformis]